MKPPSLSISSQTELRFILAEKKSQKANWWKFRARMELLASAGGTKCESIVIKKKD